jgi:cytosine/adenosine deaminase-related metal-dependent hydrolase
MARLLVAHGTVVTQGPDRDVIEDGAVAVDGDTIAAVGPTAAVRDEFDPERTIDASGKVVMPGLVNTHTHVSDILLRGYDEGGRALYDWLFNVKQPGIAEMTAEEHELAAALYCAEALSAGVTTFVENDAEIPLGELEPIETKLNTYLTAGVRSIYARGVRDLPPDEGYLALVERITAREPSVDHPDQELYVEPLDDWLDELDGLYGDYHGAADGRCGVWVAPIVVEGMTDRGLRETYRFAEERDVMTTIHTAEAPVQTGEELSPIEYLRNVGSLGEHALLGHCVQVDDRDVRMLARTDTRVAHNIASNMALGNGFAPVPSMRAHGVTVGMGTDNATLSDTVNPLADLRLAGMAHKGHHTDPDVVTAQSALDMVTIEAARSIRRGDDLGSLERGKQADIAVLDFASARLTPAPDVVRALVYQTLGTEVETVICDGEVVVEDGRPVGIAEAYPDLYHRAGRAAERVATAAGIAESRSHESG